MQDQVESKNLLDTGHDHSLKRKRIKTKFTSRALQSFGLEPARWLIRLTDLEFVIIHGEGTKNQAVDALLRLMTL